mgnify:FL=1
MSLQKVLVINTKYRIFGGEDSNIIDEINLLNKYFDVEYLEFNNSVKLGIHDLFAFLTNSNTSSNKMLVETIRRFNPDLAYVHNTWFKSNLGIFKLLKKEGIKTLHKIHNYRFDCSRYLLASEHLKGNSQCPACGMEEKKVGFYNKYYSNSFIKSFFLSRYSKKYFNILKNDSLEILVLSKFQKDYLTNLGINSEKISIYPNPIEIKEENFKKYNPESESVVFAGRLVETKGIEEILKTWNELNPENLTLKIIGTSETEEYLKKKYASPSVEFLGLLKNNEVKNIIKEAKAIITATKLFEGQPRVLLEASSYGVPSIYPSFGGMDEFFPEGYKLSFQQFDYKDLSRKISILSDKNLLDTQSKEIIKFVSKKLNEKALINQLKSCYGEGVTNA